VKNHGSHIRDGACDSRRGGGERRREKRAPAGALASFEVPVARADGVLSLASRSPFMAMHMEQPGSRHSAPRSRKTVSSPSASAARFTPYEPGTTKDAHAVGNLPAAHDRRRLPEVERRELVQLPMNTTSTLWPRRGLPGAKPHVSERLLEGALLRAINGNAPDPETGAVMGYPSRGSCRR